MINYSMLFLLGCVFTFFCYCVIADQIGEKNDPEKYCKCIDYDCGCCTQLKVKHVLSGKLCGNFSYLPDQYGVSATITYNNIAIYNETVSVKNPPPICTTYFNKIKMEICFRLYDLDVHNRCFSGCGDFEVVFFNFFPVKKLSIGCFGQDCKKSQSLLIEIKETFYYLTGKTNYQDNPQPEVVLINSDDSSATLP